MIIGKFGDTLSKMHEQHAQTTAAHQQAMQHMIETMSAPRRVVRGPDGRVSHSELVKH